MGTFLKSGGGTRRRSSLGSGLSFSSASTEDPAAEANRLARQTNPLVGVTNQLVRQRQQTEQEAAMERVKQLIEAGQTDTDEFRTMVQVAEKGYAEPKENPLQRVLNAIEGVGNVTLGAAASVASDKLRKNTAGLVGFSPESGVGMAAKAFQSEGGVKNLFNRDYEPLAEAAGPGGAKLFGLEGEAGPGAKKGHFAFGDIIKYDVERATGTAHEDQPWWARAAISTAGYVGDELLNPVNYIGAGLGGVSREVAVQGLRNLGKQTATRLAREAAEEGIEKVLARTAADAFERTIAEKVSERVTATAIRETAEEMAQKAGTEVTEATLKEAREALAKSVADDVTAPWAQAVANRDFAAIPEAIRKSGSLTKEMPYLGGGVRFIPNPFSSGLKGAGRLSRPIPGTAGLGRKLSRTVLGTRPGTVGRGFLFREADEAAGSGLAGKMSKALEAFEASRARQSNRFAAILAAKRGQLGAFDDITGGLQKALRETGMVDRHHAFSLLARDAAKELNHLDEDALDQVGNLMHAARHGGVNLADPEARAGFVAQLPDALSEKGKAAVVDFMDQAGDTLDFMFEKARAMGIDISRRENYWPLIWTPEFTNDLERLAARGVGFEDITEVPEGIREGVAWIIEAINGVNAKRAASDTVAIVGDTRFSNERILGLETQVKRIGDVTLVGNANAPNLRYTSHIDMKDQIDKAAQWLADRQGIKLRSFGRTGRGSVENDPIRAMNVYFRSMEAAITERNLQRQGREAGWITDQTWRVATDRTVNGILQGMYGSANQRRVEKLSAKIGAKLGVIEGELENPEIGLVAQKAGDFELAVPRRAAMDPSPRMARAKQRLEQRSAAMKAANRTYEQARERLVAQLEAQGVPAETAQALAGAQTLTELKEVAQAAETALRDDLRASTDALWQTVARVRADAEGAARKFDRAARAARRDAAATDRAIARMRDSLHKKITASMNVKRALTFDDDASRQRLAQLLSAHFAEQVKALDPEGKMASQVVDILERAARGEAVDGAELKQALNVGRETYFENAVADEGALDRARGLILDAFDQVRREWPQADPLIGSRKTLNLFDNHGPEGLFQHWRNVSGALKQAAQQGHKKAGDALRIAEDVDRAMLTLASEAGSNWHVRKFLSDNALYDQVDMVRKVLEGRNVYVPTKLQEVLEEIGLVGENLKFQTRKGGLGFQLVPTKGRFITPLDIIDEAKGLAEPGVRSIPDVYRAQVAAGFSSESAYERYMRGTLKGWNGANSVPIAVRDSYYAEARRILKREFEEATDVQQVGDFYRVRSKGGRVLWAELDTNGDPVAWAVLGEMPMLGRGTEVGTERFLDMLTSARRFGDDLGNVLDGADWKDVYGRARSALGRLSDESREALDALGASDADAGMLSRLSDTLDEALDAARNAPIGDLEAARSERLAAAEAFDEIRDIIRPLKNRSASKAEADAAMLRFESAAKVLGKVLPPADRGQLDLIRFQIERVQAVAAIKGRKSPLLEKMLDAREDMVRKWTNPDRLLEGFQKAADERQQVLQGAYLEDAVTTQNMIHEMNSILQRILGFAQDEDGVVRKVFLPKEQEEYLEELVQRGKGLWADVFGADNPFETVKVPVPHADGFIPPEQAKIGGAAWNGVVGQEAAMRWVSNVTAMMVSASDDEVLEGFARFVRTALSGWRANATVARPTFHMRNLIGGLWNSAMAGATARNFAFSSQWSARFIEDLKRTPNVEDIFAKYPEEVAKVMRAAWGEGIVHQSFSASEIIAEGLTRPNFFQRLNIMGKDNVAVMAGGRAMEHIEFWMRLAVFHRHFNPASELPQEAAAIARSWVDMVHFDYANLTRTERKIKQFLPFFVWFRRNLPLQMQVLIERPGYLARYQNIITNADVYDDTAFDDLPPNQYRMGTTYGSMGAINDESPFWTQWLFDPDLPIKQVLELGNPLSPAAWSTMLANQLGPQFDIAASLVGGGDENYWVNAPGGISQVLNWVDSFNGHGVDDGLLSGVDSTPMGVARLRPFQRTLYTTMFPSLNELGGFALEQDPRRRADLGQQPLYGPAGEDGEPDTLTDELKAAIAMLARGVGVQGTSPGDAYSTMVGQSFERGDADRELKKRGLAPEEETKKSNLTFG